MKKVILLVLLSGLIYSQNTIQSSLSDKILFGGDLGVTFTFSDYNETGSGLIVRGVGEYYFLENRMHKFGLRAFAGYGISSGSDNRYSPSKFSTNLYTVAGGGIYSLQLSNDLAPFAFLGLKYLRFNPQDEDGKALPNNAAEKYDRNEISVVFEFGIRYQINDNLYTYGSLVPFSFSNDYIDDRVNNTNDIVMTVNFGLLYAIDAPWASSRNEELENSLPFGVEISDTESTELETSNDDEVNENVQEVENSESNLTKADEENMDVESENADNVIEMDAGASKSNIIEDLSAKLDIGSVQFEYGKTEFGRMEYVELDRIARIISEDQKSRWSIAGYTDDKEPVQVHQSLGIQRAYFVLRYFMTKGIERDRFEIVVKGEADPVGDNSTPEGRAKNRRVEVSRIK